MEIENIKISWDNVRFNIGEPEFEVDLDEVVKNLENRLDSEITYDDDVFYIKENEIFWNDKYGNEESEFEKIKIELSVISEALLMSKPKEIETV